MPFRPTVDDVAFLISPGGVDALARAAALPLSDASMLTDLTRLRRWFGDRGTAVGETVRLRRLAVGKLGPVAAQWLLTDEALQQASPARVAAHRANRLQGHAVHDLTCSIGSDLAALARSSPFAVGSDLDPVRVAMARHNLAVAGLATRVWVADACTRTSRGLLAYADPSRRTAGGRRITSADTIPSVADLDAAHAGRPPVLRVPPGLDYDTLGRPGEVELVSWDGVVREMVLWPAELATAARRATILRGETAVEQVTSADADDVAVTGVGEWIVDPDPAVVRAHLVRQYAARHALTMLDPHLAYLTGPNPPTGVRAFHVLDVAPLSDRVLAGWIRRDGVGTLEIKQRGTPVVPDDLRRRLRPVLGRDTRVGATVMIARVGSGVTAFWCRARAGAA